MNMRTHFKTDTISFANSFLLLAVVAGVLNIDLFENDAVSGYYDYKVLYRIELVFNAERFPLLSISEDIPGNDVVKTAFFHHIFMQHASVTLYSSYKTGKVNTRPFYSSSHSHTKLFNIPHQNSDEDEAFILSVDVAQASPSFHPFA